MNPQNQFNDEHNPYRTPSVAASAPGPPAAPTMGLPLLERMGEGTIALAWLVFWLMATFGGGAIGAVLGGVMGGLLAANGMKIEHIRLIAMGLGFLLGIPISYFCFRMAVVWFIIPAAQRATESPLQYPPPGHSFPGYPPPLQPGPSQQPSPPWQSPR